MPKNSKKRKRGYDCHNFGPCDLHVMLPHKSTAEGPIPLVLDQLFSRLATTGYQTIAISHTVYGGPPVDLPMVPNIQPKSTMRVLQRLHVVVENVSDLSLYPPFLSEKLRNDYEIISVSPRNEAVFQQVCTMSSVFDIISLDYASGERLAFKLRASDVESAVGGGMVFEIPYASAILHKNHRKGLIQTCRELQVASLGKNLKVLMCSGGRVYQERDVGAMALRTPEDIVNLAKTVLRFDGPTSSQVNSQAARFVLEKARNRRFGESRVVDVYVDTESTPDRRRKQYDNAKMSARNTRPLSLLEGSDEKDNGSDVKPEVVEDGFIAL
jgi:RNase P/RNase MRP subunit p30